MMHDVPTSGALQTENEHLRQRVAELEQMLDEQAQVAARLRKCEEEGQWLREALQQQQDELNLLKLLVENSPDGIGVADMNGIFIYANPAYGAMTGYGVDMVGMGVNQIVAPEVDGAGLIPQLLSHGAWQGILPYRRKDGTHFQGQLSIFVARDATGHVYGLPAIVRDITGQLQREQELATFKILVENSPDAIALSLPDGTLTYANKAYGTLSGYGDAIVGMKFYEHYDPEGAAEAAEAAQQIMEQGLWSGTLHWQQKDGTRILVQGSVFAVRDNTGQTQALAGIFRDITEQQRQSQQQAELQQQLITAQQVAIRELSTPLIPIADNVVVMPLIGTIDSQRAQMVMETLLEGLVRHHAEIVILDITGVQVVDSQVANTFIQAAQAVRLLGAQVIMTGIQPQIAQALVHLGVDLRGIVTRSTLQAGIAHALK